MASAWWFSHGTGGSWAQLCGHLQYRGGDARSLKIPFWLTSLGLRGFGEEEEVITTIFFPVWCPSLLPDWCGGSLERVFSMGRRPRPCTGSLCQCYRLLSHFERGSESVPCTQRTKPLQRRVSYNLSARLSACRGPNMKHKKGLKWGKKGVIVAQWALKLRKGLL